MRQETTHTSCSSARLGFSWNNAGISQASEIWPEPVIILLPKPGKLTFKMNLYNQIEQYKEITLFSEITIPRSYIKILLKEKKTLGFLRVTHHFSLITLPLLIFKEPSFSEYIDIVNNKSACGMDFQPIFGKESLLVVLHASPSAGPCNAALQRIQGRTVSDMSATTMIYQRKDQTPPKFAIEL